jgi:serine/threonine protein kinase
MNSHQQLDGSVQTVPKNVNGSGVSLDDPRVHQAMEEYLKMLQAGEHPDRSVFLSRYPDLATPLAACLQGLDFVHAAGAELSHPAKRDGSAPADAVEPAESLGDFRIIREVGRGGMGVVYEAVQVSLGRRVALKVLPFAATMDPRHLQRFKNEAHAAAQLHHTNIVPVYSVGCERSVHFYAMQFIEGQSLADVIASLRKPSEPRPLGSGEGADPTTAYHPLPDGRGSDSSTASVSTKPIAGLSTRRSTTDAAYFRTVAELGIQAAEALDYAHEHGIIHRDIKPANLLVDAESRLWVTDFGLAQVQGDARMTMTGDLVGTLRYMSPEQALAKRVVVDHRTDIYSLGATLYELLTLGPAFSGTDRQELLRQIAFEEPRAPRRQNKAIPAELEIIMLKTLEKNPTDRYATAKELAEDLRRYVMDEPIRARRPSVAQRLRKWGRRHQAAVTSALAFLVLAVIILAGSTIWVWKAANAEKVAKQTAQKRLENFEKANDILGSIFKRIDPNEEEKGGENLRVQLSKSLDEAARLLEDDDISDPLVVARLQYVLGRSLLGLGDHRKAHPLLEKSSQTREALLGADDPDTLDSKDDLAMVYEAQGKYDEAEALWLEVIRVRTASKGADDPFTLTSKHHLAMLYHWNGKGDRSIPLLKEVLESQKVVLGDDHEDVLMTKENLAGLYQENRKYDLAEPLTLEVMRLQTAKFGADHAKTLTNKNNLAMLYQRQDKHDQAETMYLDVIRRRTATLGADHPSTLSTRRNLATLYTVQNKFDQAEPILKECVRLGTDRLGPTDLETLKSKHNLAAVYHHQMKYDLALPLYSEVLQIRTAKLGAGNHFTLTTKNNLAALYLDQRKLDQAERLLKEIVALDPKYESAQRNLGKALRENGKIDEAIFVFQTVTSLNPDSAEAHCDLGDVLFRQGRFVEALAARRRGHELGSKSPGWRYPSGEWVRKAELLVELDAKLPKILNGEVQPADAAERIALAQMCQKDFKKLYVAAVRLYREAFGLEPATAEKLGMPGSRYDAACAAALAGCHQGNDANEIGDDERTRLRKQALEWLRADLAAFRQLLDKQPDQARAFVAQQMSGWLQDNDFAGVRGSTALAKLSVAERAEWTKLWQDVAAFGIQAAEGKAAQDASATTPELVPPPKEVLAK